MKKPQTSEQPRPITAFNRDNELVYIKESMDSLNQKSPDSFVKCSYKLRGGCTFTTQKRLLRDICEG